MRYLFGDSTETDLEFSYLSLIREVVDCSVVMLQAEASLASNHDRRRIKDDETAGLIRAVEELGKEASALVDPVAKEQAKVPVGRCASAIAAAIKEAVEREAVSARSALATTREEIDHDDQKVRAQVRGVVEKLLRLHDLPGAEKEYDVTWAGGAAKATLRQRTNLGFDVVVELDASGSALLAHDLRVDKVDPTLEVHAHEAGGWLKKSDKLVVHKLARYQVVRVSVAKDTTILLKSVPDGAGLTIIVKQDRIMIEGTGSNAGKEFTPDDRDTAKLQQFAGKLAGALRGLEQRTALVSADIDQKPLAEHEHPRLIADRLIGAIAPSVQLLSKHSRNPQELVLRRQLADDRREEMFIAVSELVRKIEVLPPHAQSAFATLQLPGVPTKTAAKAVDPAVPEAIPSGDAKPIDAKWGDASPVDTKPLDSKPLDTKSLDTKPVDEVKPLPAITAPRPKTPSAVPLVPVPLRDKPKTVPPSQELREPASPSAAIDKANEKLGD